MVDFDPYIGRNWMCIYQLHFENDDEDECYEENDVMMGLLKWFLTTIF